MKKTLVSNVGSFVENSIGSFIEHRREAPELLPGTEPVPFVWYRKPVPEAICGDGSPFHMYLRRGSSDKLVIFLSGGGMAWNAYTAARPVTGAATAAMEPNFYWNNLRPFTQIMNINIGITQNDTQNPFYDWNFIVVPYATGDFHVGNGELAYTDLDGQPRILRFHGRANARAVLAAGHDYFPSAGKILIAGDSAGAFAVPALAEEIVTKWYPDCPDVTLLSDSGQLLTEDWKRIARNVWGASREIYAPLNSRNITLDWYRRLLVKFPKRFRLLYASSTHDYLLSTFFNDMANEVFETDEAVREIFARQLSEMIRGFLQLDPSFTFFINNWENPLFTKAQRGTIHTVVRTLYFFVQNMAPEGHLPGHANVSGVTMAQWLADQIGGDRYDVGTGLLV